MFVYILANTNMLVNVIVAGSKETLEKEVISYLKKFVSEDITKINPNLVNFHKAIYSNKIQEAMTLWDEYNLNILQKKLSCHEIKEVPLIE